MLALAIAEDRVGGFNFGDLPRVVIPGSESSANGGLYPPRRTYVFDFASGKILYEEYNPFGTSAYRAVDSTIQVSAKRYRYAAAERDEETGLDHMGLRYYAPWLRRWTSADPIGISGGINLYGYAASNPVSMKDPGGTKPQTVHQEGMKQFELRAADIRQQESQVSRSEADFQTRARETLGPEGFANLDADRAERQALIDEARSLNYARSELAAGRAELDADIKAFTRGADAAARIGRYARPVETAGFVVLGGTAALVAAPVAVAVAEKGFIASPGLFIAGKEVAHAISQGEGGGAPTVTRARVVAQEAKAATLADDAAAAARRTQSHMVTAGEAAAKEAATQTRASVDDKLARYLLNAGHPQGGSKAKWFEQALGFTQENADDLAKQIVFHPSTAVKTAVTEFGTKFEQVISITGANGKTIDVLFAWIRNNDGVVRLVTGIPSGR